jgi:hypothetical protein
MGALGIVVMIAVKYNSKLSGKNSFYPRFVVVPSAAVPYESFNLSHAELRRGVSETPH